MSISDHPLFSLFVGDTGGIDSWLAGNGADLSISRLERLPDEPITCGQLNQLLALSHQAGVSQGFFKYYWGDSPLHPYPLSVIPGYSDIYGSLTEICTLDQFLWGMYRIYVDSLLYFGSVRSGYRALRRLTHSELQEYFGARRYDVSGMIHRGPVLSLQPITQDHRYLISEMACKNFAPAPEEIDMEMTLIGAWEEHRQKGGRRVRVRDLLDGEYFLRTKGKMQRDLFVGEEIFDTEVETLEELKDRFFRLRNKWAAARDSALENTKLYLSMADDLDVYVATSMRTREQFRSMAANAQRIFSAPYLKPLNLRYFDPTMSAANGHEDKGLIECLMVKCAKVLIYMAGERDSYGKDAEAAMALSLGKPVIVLCDDAERHNIFQEIHPLSRLVEFETGVAVGVMASSDPDHVPMLLHRLFNNEMQYELEHPRKGFFRLKERLTGSTIRLQTNDVMLRETFWNCYHKRGS